MLQIKEAKKTFFKSKEHYLEFLAAWKKAANLEDHNKRPRPTHYIIYALLREYPETHAFTPITSKKKLDNGRRPYESLIQCRWSIQWANTNYKFKGKLNNLKAFDHLLEPFGGTVDPEYLHIIAEMLKTYDGPLLAQEFAPIFDVQVPNGL